MAGETQVVGMMQEGGETPQGESQQSRAVPGAPGKVEELPEWAQAVIRQLRREDAARRKAEEEAAAKAASGRRKCARWHRHYR